MALTFSGVASIPIPTSWQDHLINGYTMYFHQQSNIFFIKTTDGDLYASAVHSLDNAKNIKLNKPLWTDFPSLTFPQVIEHLITVGVIVPHGIQIILGIKANMAHTVNPNTGLIEPPLPGPPAIPVLPSVPLWVATAKTTYKIDMALVAKEFQPIPKYVPPAASIKPSNSWFSLTEYVGVLNSINTKHATMPDYNQFQFSHGHNLSGTGNHLPYITMLVKLPRTNSTYGSSSYMGLIMNLHNTFDIIPEEPEKGIYRCYMQIGSDPNRKIMVRFILPTDPYNSTDFTLISNWLRNPSTAGLKYRLAKANNINVNFSSFETIVKDRHGKEFTVYLGRDMAVLCDIIGAVNDTTRTASYPHTDNFMYFVQSSPRLAANPLLASGEDIPYYLYPEIFYEFQYWARQGGKLNGLLPDFTPDAIYHRSVRLKQYNTALPSFIQEEDKARERIIILNKKFSLDLIRSTIGVNTSDEVCIFVRDLFKATFKTSDAFDAFVYSSMPFTLKNRLKEFADLTTTKEKVQGKFRLIEPTSVIESPSEPEFVSTLVVGEESIALAETTNRAVKRIRKAKPVKHSSLIA